MSGVVALIPARSQSKRIPDKNIYSLKVHPLIAYSIASALESKLFDRIIVSTESKRYAEIAKYYGAEVIMRPEEFASDTSPDIEWVKYTLERVKCDSFSILRPTSPFRTANTIKRVWDLFNESPICDSIRAVEMCSQHPGKMWVIEGRFIKPLLQKGLHNLPYQSLPSVYIQNASLEIAWTDVVFISK